MPALGIGAPLVLAVQALIAGAVYAEAKAYGSRSPLVVALAVFILGTALAIGLDAVLVVIVGQLLLIAVYRLGVFVERQRSTAT